MQSTKNRSVGKRIFLMPGCVDANRGDQALVWTAIDLIRSLYGDGSIIHLLTAEAHSGSRDAGYRQTNKKNISLSSAIIQNPNRLLRNTESNINYSKWGILKVSVCAAGDFFFSLTLLLFARHQWLALRLLNSEQKQTFMHLSNSELAVVKGGGFIYAYRGLKSYYYLWYVLFHVMLAQRLDIPVAILPNSFGPFETGFSKFLTRRVLRKCKFVATREAQSQAAIEKILPDCSEQFPDMAFSLTIDQSDRLWAKNELERQGVRTDGKAVGITMRPWRFPGHTNPQEAYELYLEEMKDFCMELSRRDFQPVFFVHVKGPGHHEMDRVALEDCQSKFTTNIPLLIDGDYDCVQVKALYSHLGFMIGTRFHSCIFAMSERIPTIAISYQGYKASGIMEDMGLSDFHINIADVNSLFLLKRFDQLCEQKSEITTRYRTYLEDTEQQFKTMHDSLLTLFDTTGS